MVDEKLLAGFHSDCLSENEKNNLINQLLSEVRHDGTEIPFHHDDGLGDRQEYRSISVRVMIPEAVLSPVDFSVLALYAIKSTLIHEPLPEAYGFVECPREGGPWVYLSGSAVICKDRLLDQEVVDHILDLVKQESMKDNSPCTDEYLNLLEQKFLAMRLTGKSQIYHSCLWMMVLRDLLKRDWLDSECPQIVTVIDKCVQEKKSFVRSWRISTDDTETMLLAPS